MTKDEKLAALEDLVSSVVEGVSTLASRMTVYKMENAKDRTNSDWEYEYMTKAEAELRTRLMNLVEAVVEVDA